MEKLKIFTSLNLTKSFWFLDLERTENSLNKIKIFCISRKEGENLR